MLSNKRPAYRACLLALLLITCVLLFVNKASADQVASTVTSSQQTTEEITLTSLGKLPSTLEGNVIEILPVTKKENTYYVVTKEGDIFYAELSGKKKTSNSATGEARGNSATSSTIKQIFSLKQRIPKAISLDALALHPSFFLRDQQGENTLYTSHLEPSAELGKALIERSEEVVLDDIQLHSVITEWQLDSVGEVDLTSPREIIRIALPADSKGVNQLAFSANLQAWQENYGLMYLSLSEVENWKNTPLYSGAILRINPQKFGLKNYTSPTDNPFTKQTKNPHELWAYRLGKINQFSWLARQHNTIAIDRTLLPSRERQLGKVNMGVTDSNAVKPLAQWPINPNANTYLGGHSHLFNYRGKSLSGVANSLVYLRFNEVDSAKIQINTLDIYANSNSTNNTVWQFDAPQAMMLTTDNNNELIVYQRATKRLMIVTTIETQAERAPNEVKAPALDSVNSTRVRPQEGSSNKLLLISVLIVFVIVGIFYTFKRFSNRKLSTRHFLEQQLVKIKFESSLQELILYKYHQESIDRKVHCKELSSIELLVNEESCFIIHRENGLTNQTAKEGSQILSSATQTSLGTNDLRTIVLLLTLVSGEQLPVYMYVRKSKHRLTRVTYEQCQDDALNLCWELSAIIAPATTDVRDTPSKPSPTSKKLRVAAKVETKPVRESVSHTKAAEIEGKQSTSEKQITDPTKDVSDNSMPAPNTNESMGAKANTSEREKSLDIEVVNALEKLVKLKQQNFLSDEEFEQAKAKLLKDL